MSEDKRYMIWDKLGNIVHCDSHDSYEEAKIQYVNKLIALYGYKIGVEGGRRYTEALEENPLAVLDYCDK